MIFYIFFCDCHIYLLSVKSEISTSVFFCIGSVRDFLELFTLNLVVQISIVLFSICKLFVLMFSPTINLLCFKLFIRLVNTNICGDKIHFLANSISSCLNVFTFISNVIVFLFWSKFLKNILKLGNSVCSNFMSI